MTVDDDPIAEIVVLSFKLGLIIEIQALRFETV